jgi:alkylated DNA repair dioxygenase AlkB
MNPKIIYGAGYHPPLYTQPEMYEAFRQHLLALPWWSERAARHEYFMSDTPRTYSYGNRNDAEPTQYNSAEFTPDVRNLMKWLNTRFGIELNVCFLNKYDDQHNALGWHADDFPGMRSDQPIIVMSYGAVREIWVKDKRGFPCPACAPGRPGIHCTVEQMSEAQVVEEGEPTCMECFHSDHVGFVKGPPNGKQPDDQRVALEEGSIFLMPAGYQDTHLHRIPKHDRPCGWRISLTFRSFA